MMNDPSFKSDMKKFTDSASYKAAMTRATADIEVILLAFLSSLIGTV